MDEFYEKAMDYLFPQIQRRLMEEQELDDEVALKIIGREVFEYFEDENIHAEYEQMKLIAKKIFYKTRTKLNILKPLLDDGDVTEIMVNNCDNIFYEKNNQIFKYQLAFDSNEEVEEVMHMIAGDVNREINELNPIVDARLADGSRVNGVYKNVAVNGPTLTIRKFSKDYISIEQLVANKTLTKEGAVLLKVLVQCGYNIFISGGTSSGKTTLINALGGYIPKGERVIVIEDSAELKLHSIENLVQMECRNSNSLGKGKVSMSSLIKNSLRMRPDRIIVGEVRGEEVFHMLQAMNTGHSGMSTGHGNSIEGMLKRLETMYLMAASIDIDAIRSQIAEGLDILVHIEKIHNERRIVEIAELLGYEKGEYRLNKLMTYDKELRFTGNGILNSKKIFEKGEQYAFELQSNGIDLR